MMITTKRNESKIYFMWVITIPDNGELWIIHIPLVSVYDPRQDFLFFHYTAATDLDESL